jgi:hypothetical protein
VPYLSIPHGASHDRAEIWVAALNEPEAPAELRVGGAAHPLPAAWQRWTSPDGSRRLRHQTVVVPGLASRHRYSVELRVAGQQQARCSVSTLPAQLPGAGDDPLLVMLGSCFCLRSDQDGRAGTRYAELPGAKPDLNILCGDQVYLDAPWWKFLRPFGSEAVNRMLFDSYWENWSDAEGFERILAQGPNWFLGDDHEFWNNAPNAGVFPVNSWRRDTREEWLELARTLYRAFQSRTATTEFAIPPLSFFLADTRIHREEGRSRFMAPADLVALGDWVDGLRAPGVLVIGQPVFAAPGSVTERLADLGLPDYEQYGELVHILFRARHSLLVLTGDVHFGRVARCALPSGAELIEVISSPLALVDRRAGGKWGRPPARFPAVDVGVPPARIETVTYQGREFEEADNQFLTLELQSVGGEVRLGVDYRAIVGEQRRRVFYGPLR